MNNSKLSLVEKDGMYYLFKGEKLLNTITKTLMNNMIMWYGEGFIPHYLQYFGGKDGE